MLHLNGKRIILASQSPRRQALLKGLDIDFEIDVRPIDEVYPAELDPYKVPEYLANLKASAFTDTQKEDEIIVTSDTIVILGNEILEKPMDREHAIEMIRKLSGQTHTVVTAVCLQTKSEKRLFSDQTKVSFVELSEDEIEYYIDKYKPFDKAGSYGVQEWIGYVAIDKLEGSYFTVMGFPLHLVYSELKELLR